MQNQLGHLMGVSILDSPMTLNLVVHTTKLSIYVSCTSVSNQSWTQSNNIWSQTYSTKGGDCKPFGGSSMGLNFGGGGWGVHIGLVHKRHIYIYISRKVRKVSTLWISCWSTTTTTKSQVITAFQRYGALVGGWVWVVGHIIPRKQKMAAKKEEGDFSIWTQLDLNSIADDDGWCRSFWGQFGVKCWVIFSLTLDFHNKRTVCKLFLHVRVLWDKLLTKSCCCSSCHVCLQKDTRRSEVKWRRMWGANFQLLPIVVSYSKRSSAFYYSTVHTPTPHSRCGFFYNLSCRNIDS